MSHTCRNFGFLHSNNRRLARSDHRASALGTSDALRMPKIGHMEGSFMQRRALLTLAGALVVLSSAGLSGPARAQDYRISGPVAYDNLAVYPVHGSATGVPAPLTLDQALSQGTARIDMSPDSIQISNRSGQNILVPLGTLLKGGLQAQVAATS